jgi:hypothetical protein
VSDAEPYAYAWSDDGAGPILEIWPLEGAWSPFLISIPTEERPVLLGLSLSARDLGGEAMQVRYGRPDVHNHDRTFRGLEILDQVDQDTSVRAMFSRRPSVLHFGQPGGPMHWLRSAP